MDQPRTPTYPYRALADDIAAKVARGELKPGDKIPTIRALAKDYGITTATVQRGLKELIDAGVLVAMTSMGTFVTENALALIAARDEADAEPVTLDMVMDQLDHLQTALTALTERVERLEHHPDAD